MTRQRPKQGFRRIRRYRCSSGKRGFATRQAAQAMMEKVNRSNERSGDERRLRRIYLCPICLMLHTTSKEGEPASEDSPDDRKRI